jgi:hypothetical protein
VQLITPFSFVRLDYFIPDFTVQVNCACARPGVRVQLARIKILDSCVEFIRFW